VLLVRQARLVLSAYKATKARQDRKAMQVSLVRLVLLDPKVCKVMLALRVRRVLQAQKVQPDRKAKRVMRGQQVQLVRLVLLGRLVLKAMLALLERKALRVRRVKQV
jgi:hypothetical protein